MSDEHYCPRCNAPFLCFNGVNTRHFKCGSSTHIPSVACGYASQLQDRIKRLEEELMDAKNKHAALVADVVLYEDRGERIKRLEEAGDLLTRMVCRQDGYGIYQDEEDAVNSWHKAKEAKP